MRTSYKILVVIFEGKRPLGKHRHRWENNTTTYFEKENVIERYGLHSIE
jgi:hypothetical protein